MDRIKNMSVRIESDNFYCIYFRFGSNRIFHDPDRIELKKCPPKNPDLIESNSKKSRVGSDQIGSDHQTEPYLLHTILQSGASEGDAKL